jgi:hypothetical protein
MNETDTSQTEFDTDLAHLRSLADLMFEYLPHQLQPPDPATIEQQILAETR